MEQIVNVLHRAVVSLPLFAVTLAMLFLGKWLFTRTSPFNFHEQLAVKDNPALGTCFAGYLIGLAIALAGILFGGAGSLGNDLPLVAVAGLACVGLTRLGILINEKVVLYRFNVTREMISDRNVGAGFVVAGSCIATGLMLNGVMTGQSEPLLKDSAPLWLAASLGALRDITFYWVLGQVILVLGGLLFEVFAGYNVQKAIGAADDRNLPSGIALGGFLVAVGIVTRAALVGAGSRLLEEAAVTAVIALCGIALLILAQKVVGRLLFSTRAGCPGLPKELVADRNVAAGAIEAACSLAVAILLAAAITH